MDIFLLGSHGVGFFGDFQHLMSSLRVTTTPPPVTKGLELVIKGNPLNY